MATRRHAVIERFDPDVMLHAVRDGHTEHFLPRPSACSGELWHWSHNGVCVDSGLYHFEAVVRGTLRPGMVCLGSVVEAIGQSTEVNGQRLKADSVELYPDRADFFYHAQPGTRWMAVQASRDDLQHAAERTLGRTVDLSPRTVTSMRTPHGARRAVVAMTERAMAHAAAPHGDGREREHNADDALADALLQSVVEALDLAQRDDAFDEHQIRLHQRLTLVRKAQDLLRLSLDEPYDSQSLCAALNAPERTVQLAFQRVCSMSPSRWLHTARLYEARRRLLGADPGKETVAGVAARCGLTHAGRFSCDYVRLFGEAPSTTLRVG